MIHVWSGRLTPYAAKTPAPIESVAAEGVPDRLSAGHTLIG
jgi:hypothetical protein